MADKVQFVFARHVHGELANAAAVQNQPPLGALVLASVVQRSFPECAVEVLDGNQMSERELVAALDADFVGFSVWFSNYESALSIASAIRHSNPRTKIAFGGHHATALGQRILANNRFVDMVFLGESECSLLRVLAGEAPSTVSGVLVQQGEPEKVAASPSVRGDLVELDILPLLSLECLRPAFRWCPDPDRPGMSAFPVAGVRGCLHSQSRCEYCSISSEGFRHQSAETYRRHLFSLYDRYGIDYFFETGDLFPRRLLHDFANEGSPPPFSMRVYGRPAGFTERDRLRLRGIGVRLVFLGVESVLHWERPARRSYPEGYSSRSLLHEIAAYGESGLAVWPGFLLGLPGETQRSLDENLGLIREVASLPNVPELTVSVAVPLPGTAHFNVCLKNPAVRAAYTSRTGQNLKTADLLDFGLLAELFVAQSTSCGFAAVAEALETLRAELSPRLATWRMVGTIRQIQPSRATIRKGDESSMPTRRVR